MPADISVNGKKMKIKKYSLNNENKRLTKLFSTYSAPVWLKNYICRPEKNESSKTKRLLFSY